MPRPDRNEYEGFHLFKEGDGFEVFWLDGDDPPPPGWYWWPRLEGLEPDNDAEGPFETSQEAHKNAYITCGVALPSNGSSPSPAN